MALLCATFPLIWMGGLVTTYDAGMAVPDWPNTFGYNLFAYPWQTWLFGPWDVFVEHGHRLLGALAGMLAIALAVACWIGEPRRWVRWLAVGALGGVIAQGVLGGMRVLLDERLLAQIHACTGPAFFAYAAALSVVTSRRWREAPDHQASSAARRVQRLALFTAALAYVQLVVGSELRHGAAGGSSAAFGAAILFHVLLGLALTAHVFLLALRTARLDPRQPSLSRPAARVAVLVAVQVVLGAGAWIVNYGWPGRLLGRYAWTEGFVIRQDSWLQALVTTSHVAIGSVILATSVVVSLRAFRLLGRAPQLALAPRVRMEAVL